MAVVHAVPIKTKRIAAAVAVSTDYFINTKDAENLRPDFLFLLLKNNKPYVIL